MSFKRMLFKGKQVFVEVDEQGCVREKGGRATMKYRLEDEREYNPSVANLSDAGAMTDTVSPPQKTRASASAKKGGASKTESKPSPVLEKNAIVAYTDGGCIGNPGPSGLGYVIRYPDNSVVKKGEPLGNGTNNIAELTAIYRVLQQVDTKTSPLRIHTDSSYAIGVLTKGWKAKVNQELIRDIRSELSKFSNVQLIKVKGHAGNPDNELVDKLANTSARTQQPL